MQIDHVFLQLIKSEWIRLTNYADCLIFLAHFTVFCKPFLAGNP